uniref:Uncharacterized protein n=1 Tax=Lutzomyia longipalpis TaxID=7200 RepID=A0A7G3B357_LUTLO
MVLPSASRPARTADSMGTAAPSAMYCQQCPATSKLISFRPRSTTLASDDEEVDELEGSGPGAGGKDGIGMAYEREARGGICGLSGAAYPMNSGRNPNGGGGLSNEESLHYAILVRLGIPYLPHIHII